MYASFADVYISLLKSYPSLEDNYKYVGIDPDVDNAFALVSNIDAKPLLINGQASSYTELKKQESLTPEQKQLLQYIDDL